MVRRLFEKLRLIKPRQPHLPQANVMRLCLEPDEMNEWQKTDVIIDIVNCPFATLTESKVPNVWYHHDDRIDYLFELNTRGFHWIKGSKSALKKQGLLRHGS